jgi:DNA-binding NtrC family response regulator
VDVRVIAAANRDLKELVREGRFREDLYHRLDLYRILLPPLRDRGDDVLHLAESILTRLSRRHRLPHRFLSEIGRRRALAYGWPGNVRELAHELERALVFEDGEALNLDQLMGASTTVPTADRPANLPVPSTGVVPGDWFNPLFRFPNNGFSLEEAILRLIHHSLGQTHGNVSAAARLLGVSRDYLRYRLGGWKDGPRSVAGPMSTEGPADPNADQVPLRL